MTMAAPIRYDELSRRVQQQCGGTELANVLPALRRATRLFFQRTECWQYQLDPIDIVAEKSQYSIIPDRAASVLRILEVRLLSSEEVASGYEGSITPGQFYEFTPPATLTLNDQIKPHSAVTDGLVVKVVLLPNMEASEVDEGVFNRYGEAIIAKAIYDLKGEINKPWSDPNGREEFKIEYNRGIAAARGDLARGFSVGEGLRA